MQYIYRNNAKNSTIGYIQGWCGWPFWTQIPNHKEFFVVCGNYHKPRTTKWPWNLPEITTKLPQNPQNSWNSHKNSNEIIWPWNLPEITTKLPQKTSKFLKFPQKFQWNKFCGWNGFSKTRNSKPQTTNHIGITTFQTTRTSPGLGFQA